MDPATGIMAEVLGAGSAAGAIGAAAGAAAGSAAGETFGAATDAEVAGYAPEGHGRMEDDAYISLMS